MTREEKIAMFKARLEKIQNNIKWWMISDDDSETNDNASFIELGEEHSKILEEIIQHLEAGDEEVSCENCQHYVAKDEDGGNLCTLMRVGWYDTDEHIFCKRYEQPHWDLIDERDSMQCSRCGHLNVGRDATCSECGAVMEGDR